MTIITIITIIDTVNGDGGLGCDGVGRGVGERYIIIIIIFKLVI